MSVRRPRLPKVTEVGRMARGVSLWAPKKRADEAREMVTSMTRDANVTASFSETQTEKGSTFVVQAVGGVAEVSNLMAALYQWFSGLGART